MCWSKDDITWPCTCKECTILARDLQGYEAFPIVQDINIYNLQDKSKKYSLKNFTQICYTNNAIFILTVVFDLRTCCIIDLCC